MLGNKLRGVIPFFRLTLFFNQCEECKCKIGKCKCEIMNEIVNLESVSVKITPLN